MDHRSTVCEKPTGRTLGQSGWWELGCMALLLALVGTWGGWAFRTRGEPHNHSEAREEQGRTYRGLAAAWPCWLHGFTPEPTYALVLVTIIAGTMWSLHSGSRG